MAQHLACGGTEQALFDLICLMDREKFDISVFAMVGDGEWESKFRDAGIRVVSAFRKRNRNGSPLAFVKHQLRKAKLHWLLRKNPRKLLGLFFPDGIDIAVSYSLWGFDEAALVPGACRIKYIHGNVANNENYRGVIQNCKPFLQEFDRLICVSEESCEAFKNFTGMDKSVRMLFNPLNSENVIRLSEHPIELPEDKPIICAVGRLSPEKGFDRLIKIHKRLVEQGLHHRLVIVGDGPERENLLRLVQETKTSDSVILAGYQANPYPYMKKSLFLVCSSYTEGLPVTAMEALALGIPLVSSVPSIAEAFGGENCGLITGSDDDSLARGIEKMLADSEFYQKAKSGAHNRSAFFKGSGMVKSHEELFVELMKG